MPPQVGRKGPPVNPPPRAKAEVATLRPHQPGVGCRRAAEITAMGVQNVVESLPRVADWCVLQVDVTNAFNTLSRDAILSGAAMGCPSAFNYLRFAYGMDTPLYHNPPLIVTPQGLSRGSKVTIKGG